MMTSILIFLSIFTVLCLLSYFIFPTYRGIIRTISRVILGAVFIFSGFVKLVDPWGTTYKFLDYFEVFQLDFLTNFAMPLGMVMNVAELLIGLALFFNTKTKLAIVGVGLFMAIFTPITLYIALYNPVPDCGCFGDALIISNWETFWKNIVLDTFVLLSFLSMKQFKPLFCNKVQWGIAFGYILLGFSITIYSYLHLPLVDFSAWAKGNRLALENPLPITYYVTYQNNSDTTITKEFPLNAMPTDTTFYAQWKWLSTRTEDPNEKIDQGLVIQSEEGENVTDQLILTKEAQFLVLAYDLQKSDKATWEKIKTFSDSCAQAGISLMAITSSTKNQVQAFKEKHQLSIDFYYADDTSIKATIRSNPGLILIKNAIVLDKWHYNDFPLYSDCKATYPLN